MKTITMQALALVSLLPGLVQAQADTAVFENTWSGWLTTQEHPAWRIEDFVCFPGCPKAAHDYFGALLDDPANDQLPLDPLIGQTRGFIASWLRARSTPAGLALLDGNSEANDTNLDCHPYDFVRASMNPLPFRMVRDGNTLVINYEEWNRTRTIYLDGRDFPANLEASSLGYSIGRVEDGALVIETRGLVASTYPPVLLNAPGGHSEQLRSTERYTVLPGDTPVLTLELTLDDPGTLTEPYVYYKRWVATPGLELLTDSCADVPGVF